MALHLMVRRDAEVGNARQKFLHRDSQFAPRKMHTNTGMNPETKSHMARPPVEPNLSGRIEFGRITPGQCG